VSAVNGPTDIEFDNREDMTMRFESIWRNKWLTANAKTIGEMADALEAAAGELRAMQAQGVVLDAESDTQSDYATLVTYDPAVAEKFGFEPEEAGEDDPAETQVVADGVATSL
jgi:hypothetical protein